MVDEKVLAKIFRAAAKGAMAKYYPPDDWPPGVTWSSGPYDSKSRDTAESIAGAFDAIAEVLEKESLLRSLRP